MKSVNMQINDKMEKVEAGFCRGEGSRPQKSIAIFVDITKCTGKRKSADIVYLNY